MTNGPKVLSRASPTGDRRLQSGCMLGSLVNPTLPIMHVTGDNAMGAGNQQGRPDTASGTLRDCMPDSPVLEMKIQSEPLGDQGRPTEMVARLTIRQVSRPVNGRSNRSERNSLSGKFRPARMV